MKDALLEIKLSAYAEEMKPRERVLDKALDFMHSENFAREKAQNEFRARAAAKRRKALRWLTGSAAVAAAFALIIWGVSYTASSLGQSLFPGNNNTPEVTLTYSLSDLTFTSAAGLEEAADAAGKSLTLPAMPESSTMRFLVGKTEDGTAAVVRVRVKALTAHGTDEMEIVADIAGGLTDYAELKSGGSVAHGDARVVESRENGEWYSYIYYPAGGYAYYAVLMSPSQGSAGYYLAALPSGSGA